MSSTLTWRPRKGSGNLSDELKFKLREEFVLPRTFDESDKSFLRGLAACGVKDADKLIELISKYGEVEIKETW